MPKASRINEVKGVQSADEFLAAIDGMDTLERVPLYYGLKDHVVDFDDLYRSQERVGLMNSRTSELVGVASKRWEPVTHKDAFTQVVNSTLDLVGAETFYGKVQNNGNNASIDILFGTADVVDKLAYGIHVTNNYHVGTTLNISSLFVRAACTNGMLWKDVSAAIALNHLNKVWNMDIGSGVSRVVGKLASTGDMIGTRISDAIDDVVSYAENVDLINRILVQAGISEERGLARLQKSKWGWTGGADMSRYDLYNLVTAYASHLTRSTRQFDDVQRGATHILKTPFEDLLNAAAIPVVATAVA